MGLKTFFALLCGKFSQTRKNEWLFTSFTGDYSDSPRVLSEKLHEKCPSAEIVWILKNDASDIPEYIRRVCPATTKAEIERHRAKVVIDNNYADQGNSTTHNLVYNLKMRIMYFLRRNPKQYVYTTWHGIPLKRLGIDQISGNYTGFICNKMKMFVNSSFEKKIMEGVTLGKMEVVRLGMPRNDVLFENKRERDSVSLGVDENTHIMLYAPSFRVADTGSDIAAKAMEQIRSIAVDNLLSAAEERFGGKWRIACRFHYLISSAIDWKQIETEFQGRVINGNLLKDMADYLPYIDMLITDVSSCMFDYALTKKPCLIYFPDLYDYEKKERGFYIPINSLPFPISQDMYTLENNIRSFNSEEYKKGVNKMIEELGIVDDGNAANRIIDYILEEIS